MNESTKHGMDYHATMTHPWGYCANITEPGVPIIGMRVKLSPRGNRMFPRMKRRTGVVWNVSDDAECLIIRKDGLNYSESFHRHFWVPE